MVVEVRLISYFRSRSLKIPQGYSVTDDAVTEKRTKRQNTTKYTKYTKRQNTTKYTKYTKRQNTTKKTKN